MKKRYLGAIILALAVMMTVAVVPALAETAASVELDAPYYEPGDTVTVTVTDAGANTHAAAIETVTVTAANEENAEDTVKNIVLTETGVNTGVFVGTFDTTATYPAPDGELYVQDYEEFNADGTLGEHGNDEITVTYGGATPATATVNNDWPVVTLELDPEFVVNEPDPNIGVVATNADFHGEGTSGVTNPEQGQTFSHTIFVVTIDAPQALDTGNIEAYMQASGNTYSSQVWALGDVHVEGGNLVGYWGPSVGFEMGVSYDANDVINALVKDNSAAPLGTYTVTVQLLDLDYEDESGVVYPFDGTTAKHVLASATDTIDVVAAEPLMVSVPESVDVSLTGGPLAVTIHGSDFKGPDGDTGNKLDTVDVTVSGPNVDYTVTGWAGANGPVGAGVTASNGDTLTFDVNPNMANEPITVTVTAVDDDGTDLGPVEKQVPIEGYCLNNYPTADVHVDDSGGLSVDVSNTDGGPVNTAFVGIIAKDAAGDAEVNAFGKDFDEDGEIAADEKFSTIVIGPNSITYGTATPVTTPDVNNGHYEVTGLTYVDTATVNIYVASTADNIFSTPVVLGAYLEPAFDILGVDVYDVSLDPAQIPAGFATDVVVTVTEDGQPVTDIDTISFDGDVQGADPDATTPANGEYTRTIPATPEPDTYQVQVVGESGQKYGQADLTVSLPVVNYTIHQGETPWDYMFSGADYNYTVHVTVTDALGNPLDGYVWLGTYDADEETFTPLTGVTALPLNLDVNGEGDIEIDQSAATLPLGDLVWMVGSDATLEAAATQALLLTPVVHVVSTNTAERTFNAGWQLVSSPLDPSNPDPDVVFGDDVAPLYIYEYTAAGYAAPAAIDPGYGYWIYLIGDTTLDVEGSAITTDYSVDLADTGWHIISTPTVPVSVKGEHGLTFTHDGTSATFTEAVTNGWIYPACWGYNPVSGGYVDVQNAAMDPWLGYWLRTLVDDVTVTMPVAYSLTNPPDVPTMSSMSVTPKGGVTPPAPPTMPKNLAAAMDASGLIVYNEPNPVRDVHTTTFKVMSALPIDAIRVEIFNQAGQLVFKDEQLGDELAWHTDNDYGEYLANGVYLYRVSAKVSGQWVVTQVRKLAIYR